MTLLLIGFDHRTAPVDLLEAVAVPSNRAAKALASLTRRDHIDEAVVLSTCNRVEVYAKVSRFHAGVAEVFDHFAQWGDLDPATSFHAAYEKFDRDAARHLFSVAGGLASMVVGERQILGQVRDAFSTALAEGAVGPVLNRVFRQAIAVGKRTRSETSIESGTASIVDLALDAATGSVPSAAPRVLTVGAGMICGMAARRLAPTAGHVAITNRSPEKAERLRARLSPDVAATTHGLDAIPRLLDDVDLVVASTDASRPLITVEMLTDTMSRRPDRPLTVIDLAVPRDVERGAAEVPGVTVIDIGALRGVVADGPTGDALHQARLIIDQEADDFATWTRGVEVGPTVAALRLRAEEIRVGEIQRLASRLGHLSEAQRAAVESVTRGIVNTLLHEPTVRLKSSAADGNGMAYAAALTHLFDLPIAEDREGLAAAEDLGLGADS